MTIPRKGNTNAVPRGVGNPRRHGEPTISEPTPEGGSNAKDTGNKRMSTYTQICYHIVFSTRNRDPVLTVGGRPPLFRYIWGIVTRGVEVACYRIISTLDHVHILSSLHPSRSLADFVKDIKVASSYSIEENKRAFPGFTHWQAGYGAFTHSRQDRDPLIAYTQRPRRPTTERYRSQMN